MWILTGKDRSRDLTFRLAPGSMRTVGRANLSDFVLDVALVSRVHCRLTADQTGALVVEDLDSTNGTFVNDRRVQRAELAAGDRLRVGRMELAVARGEGAPATKAS
jgi:pSer/pThr/pTyr-binding forkhead associated (FHA) protein